MCDQTYEIGRCAWHLSDRDPPMVLVRPLLSAISIDDLVPKAWHVDGGGRGAT